MGGGDNQRCHPAAEYLLTFFCQKSGVSLNGFAFSLSAVRADKRVLRGAHNPAVPFGNGSSGFLAVVTGFRCDAIGRNPVVVVGGGTSGRAAENAYGRIAAVFVGEAVICDRADCEIAAAAQQRCLTGGLLPVVIQMFSFRNAAEGAGSGGYAVGLLPCMSQGFPFGFAAFCTGLWSKTGSIYPLFVGAAAGQQPDAEQKRDDWIPFGFHGMSSLFRNNFIIHPFGLAFNTQKEDMCLSLDENSRTWYGVWYIRKGE